MKRWVVLIVVLPCLVMTGNAFCQVDRSEEFAAVMKGLSSASSAQRVNSAKLITKAGIVDAALYEKVATLLKAGYAQEPEPVHVDEMAWLCKALAASGDLQYWDLLDGIAKGAPSPKLQHYAEQSRDMIGEYARRSRVLNDTRNWDTELSDEENQLVNMLQSKDLHLNKDAAKTIVRNLPAQEKVYSEVEARLLGILAAGKSGVQEVDTMAWLCKALAVSGDKRFRNTLSKIRDTSDNPKLIRYASNALEQLP
jgi:hypothetical protein